MWISKLALNNIRGFVNSHSLPFAKNINIFVGQNNSGKSTILAAILSLQRQSLNHDDITFGAENGSIVISVRTPQNSIPGMSDHTIGEGVDSVQFLMNRYGAMSAAVYDPSRNQTHQGFSQIPSVEPANVFYPYLSKRKVVNYIEEIREQHSKSVSGNLDTLYNKIDRLSDRFFLPAHAEYVAACESIIGFPVSTASSAAGKRAVYTIRNLDNIPITSMGEGVSNLLGLIVDLCVAENKIFVIEEIENDIHPKQLKALLKLIEQKAETNQFFISTHSNIVTKYLGSVTDSRVFKVAMSFDENSRLPISCVIEVENEPSSRLRLLEELGYEPFDFGQWNSWLILEESSAEVLIRDFLIPAFVPRLKNRLRTYSARSLNEVEPKFKDFNNLFVFIHLEQVYKNKAWVIVDSGENELKIIQKMRETYSISGWNDANFLQFTEHDFEKYYPTRFQDQVEATLQIDNKKTRQESKKTLLNEVKEWISNNPDDAKTGFAESAKEVIEILKTIKKATD